MIGSQIINYEKYNILPNRTLFDYSKNKIKDVTKINNIHDCSNMCTYVDNCIFAQYNHENKKCSLISKPQNPQFDLFLKLTHNDYKHYENTHIIPKNSDQLVNGTSLSDCIVSCDNDGACSSISFNKKNNTCYKNYYDNISPFTNLLVRINNIDH